MQTVYPVFSEVSLEHVYSFCLLSRSLSTEAKQEISNKIGKQLYLRETLFCIIELYVCHSATRTFAQNTSEILLRSNKFQLLSKFCT